MDQILMGRENMIQKKTSLYQLFVFGGHHGAITTACRAFTWPDIRFFAGNKVNILYTKQAFVL